MLNFIERRPKELHEILKDISIHYKLSGTCSEGLFSPEKSHAAEWCAVFIFQAFQRTFAMAYACFPLSTLDYFVFGGSLVALAACFYTVVSIIKEQELAAIASTDFNNLVASYMKFNIQSVLNFYGHLWECYWWEYVQFFGSLSLNDFSSCITLLF